jgi:segregation and condensation protein A
MAVGSGAGTTVSRVTSVSELDLDLDVFQGPFDLLLAVLLREEISLAEVPLGEIVVAYVDHMGEAGEAVLDLESVTEFLVLIAALCELKSRLLLPSDEGTEELGPQEAADELLARMLEYRRYSEAARMLHERLEREGGIMYRSAPLPSELRRAALDAATQVYDPDRVGVALGDLLTLPAAPDTRHIRTTVTLQRRLGVVRDLLRARKTLDFDDAFGKEDRFTQAVTLFALLELYRRGEATWTQTETFGRIEVHST